MEIPMKIHMGMGMERLYGLWSIPMGLWDAMGIFE